MDGRNKLQGGMRGIDILVKRDKTQLVYEGKNKIPTILFFSILSVRKLFWVLQWSKSECHRQVILNRMAMKMIL